VDPFSGTTLGSDPIPLDDLAFQHTEVAVEIMEALVAVMTKGKPAEGLAVAEFETAMAAFFGAKHCVGVADGTDALTLLLQSAGIGPGHEVIVPANGPVAMVMAVMRTGAWPVLADCDPVHQLLDPAAVRKRLTSRTKAVVAVHLYGQMAPVEDLAALAHAAGADLYEDAAQCAGATRHGRPPGSLARAVITSFHPGMSLGAYGGGGAILTDDDALAARVRALPDSRSLEASEAIVLTAKIGHVREWNLLRASAVQFYGELLGGQGRITLPGVRPGNEHAWHRYVVRVPDRHAVLAELQSEGIGAAAEYRGPVHLLRATEMLGYRRGDFPHAEARADDLLFLPIYPGIRYQQVARVASALRRTLRRL
jgi:dTDP-4-amino-4,6-dideoxygalactose transaminase